jgi:hypothetical protein
MKNRTTERKLKEAIANAREYIAQMSQWDDKKLMKHLDLFREQKERAYKANNKEAFELLDEYENQVIEARALKP